MYWDTTLHCNKKLSSKIVKIIKHELKIEIVYPGSYANMYKRYLEVPRFSIKVMKNTQSILKFYTYLVKNNLLESSFEETEHL